MTEKTIAQRYVLQHKLGAGGMGIVYLGHDTYNNAAVAIKQVRANSTDEALIERFKREGEALRELNHPNIVKMLDAVEEDGSHYLVMEYVSGGDLSHLLKNEEFPIEKILNIAIDLADALTRAHRLNIIHRDLKPANILIGSDGILRLTDFGVAHLGSKERVTDTNSVVGTLDYLPPEVFQNSHFDTRGDIWAFGVMLFEMLAGERPFQGETLTELLHNIIGGEIPDLEDLRPDAPIALVDLVYRMLERDIEARVPSVRIVGAELEAILNKQDSDLSYQQFQKPITDRFDRRNHNLPYEETAFVGRDNEILEISNLLQQNGNRLITILGQGGMGKTRLSIKVAYNQLEYFADGVYLVELAPLTDVYRIIPAIADAVGYQFQNNGLEHQQQLFDFLRSKHLLLVMDNYEHLIEAASIVRDILKQTASVSILATSRQPLAVQGEIVYALGGMDFPTSGNLDTALGYSAVKLFVNRAKLAQSDFELTPDNLTAVTDICHMVHGMPLGLVLAASWLSMLSPAEIVNELKTGIDILEDEVGHLPDRQRSIRAVMNYSWQQISPNERDVFMKLSVFRDGFTRSAAEKVSDATLRVLMALHNKALLRRDNSTGRYIIHELLRQYAEEHLMQSGAEEEVKATHAAYFADLMETQVPLLQGKGQLQAITLIETEMSNFVTAWKYATDEKNIPLIEKMLEGFYLYGLFRGWKTQTYEAFEYTRQAWDVYSYADHLINARLMVRFPAKDRDYLADLLTALDLAESQQQVFETAYCKQQLGIIFAHQQGDLGGEKTQRGIRYFEEAIQAYRTLDNLFYAALAMDDLAWALATSGHLERRIALLGDVVNLRRQLGDRVGLARGAGGVASSQYRSADSIATLEEGLGISKELQDHQGMAWQSAMLGLHNYNNANIDTARDYCMRAIELGDTYRVPQVGLFAQMTLFSIRLLEGENPTDIETEIRTLLPQGLENLKDQPSIYFSAHQVYLLLYVLKGKKDGVVPLLKIMLTGFGAKFLLWALPNGALWLADTDPETALAYFEYAFQNKDYGSRWMLRSNKHMAKYQELRERYSEDKAHEVWQRIKRLDDPTIINELGSL